MVMPQANEPISLRKGIRSSRNLHPIYNFVSYHRLKPHIMTSPCLYPMCQFLKLLMQKSQILDAKKLLRKR